MDGWGGRRLRSQGKASGSAARRQAAAACARGGGASVKETRPRVSPPLCPTSARLCASPAGLRRAVRALGAPASSCARCALAPGSLLHPLTPRHPPDTRCRSPARLGSSPHVCRRSPPRPPPAVCRPPSWDARQHEQATVARSDCSGPAARVLGSRRHSPAHAGEVRGAWQPAAATWAGVAWTQRPNSTHPCLLPHQPSPPASGPSCQQAAPGGSQQAAV